MMCRFCMAMVYWAARLASMAPCPSHTKDDEAHTRPVLPHLTAALGAGALLGCPFFLHTISSSWIYGPGSS